MCSNYRNPSFYFVSSKAVKEFFCIDDPPGPYDSLEESRVSIEYCISHPCLENNVQLHFQGMFISKYICFWSNEHAIVWF